MVGFIFGKIEDFSGWWRSVYEKLKEGGERRKFLVRKEFVWAFGDKKERGREAERERIKNIIYYLVFF